jgi:hypothetical protein
MFCARPTEPHTIPLHISFLHFKSFKPEPYWTLELTATVNHSSYKAQWERVRVFERELAAFFLRRAGGVG